MTKKSPHPPTPWTVGTLFFTPWIEARPGGGITVKSTAAYLISGETPYDSIMQDSTTQETFRIRGLHRFPVELDPPMIENPAAFVESTHSHYTALPEIMKWLDDNAPRRWSVSHPGEGSRLRWEFAEEVDAVLFKLRWC